MDEATIREMINRFYATTVDDVAGSSEIYADDAVLEFPQGKERIRGRANIIAFRSAYPAHVDIEPHRTVGRQDLWVNEFTIRYNGANPYNAVSIMEFREGLVASETQYFADRFDPAPSRAHLVERVA